MYFCGIFIVEIYVFYDTYHVYDIFFRIRHPTKETLPLTLQLSKLFLAMSRHAGIHVFYYI